jgi:hypothetical protein
MKNINKYEYTLTPLTGIIGDSKISMQAINTDDELTKFIYKLIQKIV